MNLYALDHEVAALEAALPQQIGADRLGVLVALAWHVRQRDSSRALRLADEAMQWLRASTLSAEERRRIRARLSLVQAEISALKGECPLAEQHWQQAQQTFEELGDAAGEGDSAMVEALIAHAQAQRDRYLAAWQRAAGCYERAGDSLARNIARAWHGFLGAHADRAIAAEALKALRAETPEPRHPALEAILHATDGMLHYGDAVARSSVHAFKASQFAREAGLVRHAIVSSLNAGVALLNLSDMEGAAECYHWAAERARQTGWPPLIGATLMRLGGLLRELDQLERAEMMYREALQNLVNQPGGIQKAETNAGLANTLFLMGRTEESIPAFEIAIQLYRDEISVDGLATNLNVAARAYARHGNAERALASLTEAEALIAKHRVLRLHVDLHEAQAEVHGHLNSAPPAGAREPSARLHYLELALTAGRQLEAWSAPPRLLLDLAHAWKAAGDLDRAFSYAEEALQAQRQEASRKAQNVASLMQARNDIERDRAELAHQRAMVATMGENVRILDQLGVIGQEITHGLDLKEVFQALNKHLHGLLDVSSFTVYLLDTETATLNGVITIEEGQVLPPRSLPLDHPTAHTSRCARERREICVDLEPGDPPVGHIPGTLPTLSLLYGPLVAREILLGVLTIQSVREQAYGERERLIFRSLCAYGAIAVDNAQAYRQLDEAKQALEEASLTDPLTGLRNRRFLAQFLDADIAQCLRRYETPSAPRLENADLVFFLVDIDHFKQVNDTLGHGAGDTVLVQMRGRLQEVFRETDYLIRWGGEEFLVVARGISRDRAPELAERIRVSVASRAFDTDTAQKLDKTCSIGFASFPFVPLHPRALSWQEVVDVADAGLYAAKRAGRNRWVGHVAAENARPEGLAERLKAAPEQAQANGDWVRVVQG